MASSSSSSAPPARRGRELLELQGKMTTLQEKIDDLQIEIEELEKEWKKALRKGRVFSQDKKDLLNVLISERQSLTVDRERLNSLINGLQYPHVSGNNFMQALNDLKEGQKQLNDKFEEKFKVMEEKVENLGVALPKSMRGKILPLIVGLIDENEQSRCVGVGSFVGKRLILTAYHNLLIDGKLQDVYKFRTSGEVASQNTYTCTLMRHDEKYDWALLSSNIKAPDYLKVPDVSTLSTGEKVVMLGFGIHLRKEDPFVDADSFAIEALYPDLIQMKASYISYIQKHHLILDWGTFAGDSGSAIILASNGAIVGMHVMHHNNAEPLPPTPPSPELKRMKEARQDDLNENVKKSVRCLTTRTSCEPIALLVPMLQSEIDAFNEELEVLGNKIP